MRKIKEIVHDLKLISEYFEAESGATPTCISDAIEILEALETIKEVFND